MVSLPDHDVSRYHVRVVLVSLFACVLKTKLTFAARRTEKTSQRHSRTILITISAAHSRSQNHWHFCVLSPYQFLVQFQPSSNPRSTLTKKMSAGKNVQQRQFYSDLAQRTLPQPQALIQSKQTPAVERCSRKALHTCNQRCITLSAHDRRV